jgi:hypothetical protein
VDTCAHPGAARVCDERLGGGAPTIPSDKDDYAPGSTVTLTGSHWQAGEPVHININHRWKRLEPAQEYGGR